MFRVPLAAWVKKLLPHAEVTQGNPTVARKLRPHLLILDNQHLHYYKTNSIFQARVCIDLCSDGHHSQEEVLPEKNVKSSDSDIIKLQVCEQANILITSSQ